MIAGADVLCGEAGCVKMCVIFIVNAVVLQYIMLPARERLIARVSAHSGRIAGEMF